ncbi:MAG: T9SS type A sorting domain-containing protein [Bacteroidales bacterium]|nr:T9SS type A sorting domain-containing protein [Bacteroidales bacterium]
MNEECLYAWEPLLINGEDVYLCYMVYKGTSSSPMRTVVCKLDSGLNLKWKRWYGAASGRYIITGTALTGDGGCLLTGEGNAATSNPSPYVLKITADGYCSMKENSEPPLRPYNCYPNPVEDMLRLEYSPDVTPGQLELYDLQGRLLRTQNSSFETVNMENLPAGTYTLRVLLEDGTSYSDKVVKQ